MLDVEPVNHQIIWKHIKDLIRISSITYIHTYYTLLQMRVYIVSSMSDSHTHHKLCHSARGGAPVLQSGMLLHRTLEIHIECTVHHLWHSSHTHNYWDRCLGEWVHGRAWMHLPVACNIHCMLHPLPQDHKPLDHLDRQCTWRESLGNDKRIKPLLNCKTWK